MRFSNEHCDLLKIFPDLYIENISHFLSAPDKSVWIMYEQLVLVTHWRGRRW